MSEHAWGAGRPRDGAQACTRDGCRVRRIQHPDECVVWQPKPRARWVLTTEAPIPPCNGVASHEWRDEAEGRRGCRRCALLLDPILASWKHPGALGWQIIKESPLPPCRGTGITPPDGPTRCTHVERIPRHDMDGIINRGQCERDALPRMVVCEMHAGAEALRLVILAMAAEIERLTQLSNTGRDN